MTIGQNALRTFAMLDSGATHSFINESFVKQHSITRVRLDESLPIHVIDGRPIITGSITHRSTIFRLSTQNHHENIALNITSIGEYPLLLGLDWLRHHNPIIDWEAETIQFASPHCLEHCVRSDQPDETNSRQSQNSSSSPSKPFGKSASDTLSSSSIDSQDKRTGRNSPKSPKSWFPKSKLTSTTLALPKISLVSSAAFQRIIKSAIICGTLTDLDRLLAPQPADDDDDNGRIPDS